MFFRAKKDCSLWGIWYYKHVYETEFLEWANPNGTKPP